jgi:hypothetical protein
MTSDEELRDIEAPPYTLPPPPPTMRPGVIYAHSWTDGSWVEIGEADMPESFTRAATSSGRRSA